jgi:hypothetical protein
LRAQVCEQQLVGDVKRLAPSTWPPAMAMDGNPAVEVEPPVQLDGDAVFPVEEVAFRIAREGEELFVRRRLRIAKLIAKLFKLLASSGEGLDRLQQYKS